MSSPWIQFLKDLKSHPEWQAAVAAVAAEKGVHLMAAKAAVYRALQEKGAVARTPPRAAAPRAKPMAKAARVAAAAAAYARGHCLDLPEDRCAMDPNCNWTKGYKTAKGKDVKGKCGARKGVRAGAAYEGPMGELLM